MTLLIIFFSAFLIFNTAVRSSQVENLQESHHLSAMPKTVDSFDCLLSDTGSMSGFSEKSKRQIHTSSAKLTPEISTLLATLFDYHGAMHGFTEIHKIQIVEYFKLIDPRAAIKLLAFFDYGGAFHGFTEEHKLGIVNESRFIAYVCLGNLLQFFDYRGPMHGFSEGNKMKVIQAFRFIPNDSSAKLLEMLDYRGPMHGFSEANKVKILTRYVEKVGYTEKQLKSDRKLLDTLDHRGAYYQLNEEEKMGLLLFERKSPLRCVLKQVSDSKELTLTTSWDMTQLSAKTSTAIEDKPEVVALEPNNLHLGHAASKVLPKAAQSSGFLGRGKRHIGVLLDRMSGEDESYPGGLEVLQVALISGQ